MINMKYSEEDKLIKKNELQIKYNENVVDKLNQIINI